MCYYFLDTLNYYWNWRFIQQIQYFPFKATYVALHNQLLLMDRDKMSIFRFPSLFSQYIYLVYSLNTYMRMYEKSKRNNITV